MGFEKKMHNVAYYSLVQLIAWEQLVNVSCSLIFLRNKIVKIAIFSQR